MKRVHAGRGCKVRTRASWTCPSPPRGTNESLAALLALLTAVTALKEGRFRPVWLDMLGLFVAVSYIGVCSRRVVGEGSSKDAFPA